VSDLPAAETRAGDRRAAVDEAAAASDAVLVRLGTGRFAVDLAHVAEVGKVPVVTRLPGLPAWMSGVANWRGRILPALDLRTLLGAAAVPLTGTARLVVLSTEVSTVGLLVDAVEGTTTVGEEMAPFPAALPGGGAELVAGQLPRADGPVAVLDVDAVMRLRETLPRGRRSA
jgi:purine-binding chemotaxis protein CheW